MDFRGWACFLTDCVAAVPEGAFVGDSFPYEIPLFNEVIVDDELLEFIGMALDSDDLHLRLAHNWVRFPGNNEHETTSTVVQKYGGGTTTQRFQGFHIDNGNNSLVRAPVH